MCQSSNEIYTGNSGYSMIDRMMQHDDKKYMKYLIEELKYIDYDGDLSLEDFSSGACYYALFFTNIDSITWSFDG